MAPSPGAWLWSEALKYQSPRSPWRIITSSSCFTWNSQLRRISTRISAQTNQAQFKIIKERILVVLVIYCCWHIYRLYYRAIVGSCKGIALLHRSFFLHCFLAYGYFSCFTFSMPFHFAIYYSGNRNHWLF